MFEGYVYGISIRGSACNFGFPTCECDLEYPEYCRDWVCVRVVSVWVRVSPWFDGVSGDPQNKENQLIYECQKACFYISMCSRVPRSCWSQAEMHSRSLMRQQLTVTRSGHCDFDVRHRVGARCRYVPNGMEMQGMPSDINCGVG